ncbi:MAG: sulfate adenylyltransferase [Phycisphaerae bacterium]
MSQIPPLGGKLIERVVDADRRRELQDKITDMPRFKLPERERCDTEMLAVGAFSPLEGFMGEADFHQVCDEMKLADRGLPWSIPITCSTDKETAAGLTIGQSICLTDEQDRELAVLHLKEKFAHDKKKECEKVYRTTDEAHPGVKVTMAQGDVCLAGPVEVLTPNHEPQFPEHRLTPAQTRAAFAERGWSTIVAFQTRNPIHRAHEYLTKCALEICDGLLIHPLVGQTQAGDIPPDVRMACYKTLIEGYYNPQRVLLSVMPAAMRYAGPREAILHAIIRRNYGCSHFIVGRDHAGVGKYYGTYDAQKLFDQVDPAVDSGLGMAPLKFEHSAWCKKCEGMVSAKTCPHGNEDHVFLSGTKVREMLAKGERPPMEFTRPEIADILIASMTKS